MSEHRLASSVGDQKAQPPTPRQTPTSTTFPSPAFETPRQCQGSLVDSGGLTPRFAEEYSVFNSTPGNLGAAQGSFADLVSTTPAGSSGGHKRLLSAEGLAVEIAAHLNHFSPNSNLPLPPVEPSRRLPSSGSLATQKESLVVSDSQSSPTISRSRSSKKARKDTTTEPPEQSQVISPPPTGHRGERKLAPKLTMQHDQMFGQPDFNDLAQQDMTALMGSPGDLFSYPLSAPATAPPNLWDPSVPMSMNLDFSIAGPNNMQHPALLSHRHTGSFDWNAEIQLFQDVNVPPPSWNQDNVQPMRRERTLAPKPPASGAAAIASSGPALQAILAGALDDPFRVVNTAGLGVDPGLVFSRPSTSAVDSRLDTVARSGPVEDAAAASSEAKPGGAPHRTNNPRGTKNGKLPDRALASSPVRHAACPGLERSYSENCGRRAPARGSLATSRPVSRPNSGPGALGSRSGGRSSSGRISPSKTMPRVSSLASIPEKFSQYRPRTSVRFTIDSHGRARAETTVLGDGPVSDRSILGSRGSYGVSASRNWDSSDDDSSTDDEPIIIPSRSNSRHASFALPDPRKPVGSIFHLRPSTSDRSASNSVKDGESEAETAVKGGDATSELRKVVEDRQKQSSRVGSARSQRLVSTVGTVAGGITWPAGLRESGRGLGGHGIRCVCDELADEGDGLMLQCESCEMWLHGRCINVTRRSMPSVYICVFCAKTRKTTGRRPRESGPGTGGRASPLASKPLRSFR